MTGRCVDRHFRVALALGSAEAEGKFGLNVCSSSFDCVDRGGKEQMLELELDKYDGICVIGGDGLLQEVITGLLRRPDRDRVSEIPIAVIPAGTANMFAEELYADAGNAGSEREGSSRVDRARDSLSAKVGEFCVAIAEGEVRKVDVLECTASDGKKVYAASCFGWGLAGSLLPLARKEVFLRSHRYWYGGFRAIVERWPRPLAAKISFKGPSGGWESQVVDLAMLVASSLPWLTPQLQVNRRGALDDGAVTLAWVPSTVIRTRLDAFGLGFQLSEGVPLTEIAGVHAARVSEFKVELQGEVVRGAPTEGPVDNFDDPAATPPYNVDGEPMAPKQSVHVRCVLLFLVRSTYS